MPFRYKTPWTSRTYIWRNTWNCIYIILKQTDYLKERWVISTLVHPINIANYHLLLLQTLKTSVVDMAVLLSSNHARNQNAKERKILKSGSMVKYWEFCNLLRKKTQQKQGWNLQESLSANPISHCLIDFQGFVTGSRQGWDFTTQDLEAFLESSSIALKMALKESLASCNLISSTDFTLKPCLSMSRIQESYWFMCRKHTHLSGLPSLGWSLQIYCGLRWKLSCKIPVAICYFGLLKFVARSCYKERKFVYLYMRARNQQMCMFDQDEPPGWAFSLVYKMQVSASSCCDKCKANKVGDRDWYIKTSISYIAFYPGMYLLHSCSHWWIDETSFCTHRTRGISQIFIHACFVVGRKNLCRQYHMTKVCGSLHLIQPLPLLKFLHAPRLCLWSHGADNQNFTQPLRQKHDQHCVLNYNIINRFTIAKKSREKKNPIALNYYCQEMRCWSNQHLWFSKNC